MRKSIHFLIGISPALAAFNFPATVAFLVTGILCYVRMESLRVMGIRIPLVSSLTDMASRPRDRGHFVLGPVTLGMGALLALVMYPSLAAVIAIYALAFGDGFASLAGRLMGRIRPAFLRGKSLEGSLACFSAVLISAYGVSRDYRIALTAAITATVTEALPLKDYDNLVLPLVVGLVVSIALL
ncbi:MAG: phosphatidate cytidylyltransferase [Treponema sp.]|nr:phosphatidate cytidylyltransferase [Treponema sp.]